MQRTTRPSQTTGMGLLNKGAVRLDFGDATWEPEICSSVLISTRCSNGESEPHNPNKPLLPTVNMEVVFQLCLSQPKSSLLCKGWLLIFHFPSCRTVSDLLTNPIGLEAATASTVSSSLFWGAGLQACCLFWAGSSGPTQKAGTRVFV